jgi:hypothetical protein
MRWYEIRIQGTKPHVVDETLCEPIVKDLSLRARHPLGQKSDSAFFRFDLGGPVIVSQPYDEIMLSSGLTVEFACLDAHEFMEAVEAAPVRKAGDASYYKIHGEYVCLVINETDRAELLAKLSERKDASYGRWLEFKKGWEERSSESTQIAN